MSDTLVKQSLPDISPKQPAVPKRIAANHNQGGLKLPTPPQKLSSHPDESRLKVTQ